MGTRSTLGHVLVAYTPRTKKDLKADIRVYVIDIFKTFQDTSNINQQHLNLPVHEHHGSWCLHLLFNAFVDRTASILALQPWWNRGLKKARYIEMTAERLKEIPVPRRMGSIEKLKNKVKKNNNKMNQNESNAKLGKTLVKVTFKSVNSGVDLVDLVDLVDSWLRFRSTRHRKGLHHLDDGH